MVFVLLKRNFNLINIFGSFPDREVPILVIANHISWWDGFWLMYLNEKVLHHKFHFMMLEDQLKKHWYFQYTGAFSVKKKSRSVIESLTYATNLLKDPENMVFMFPQGKISSLYNDSIRFEKGVDRIIEHSSKDVQLLFVANFVDYFSSSKPNLYMHIKTPSVDDLKEVSVESAYNAFYCNILNEHKKTTS